MAAVMNVLQFTNQFVCVTSTLNIFARIDLKLKDYKLVNMHISIHECGLLSLLWNKIKVSSCGM